MLSGNCQVIVPARPASTTLNMDVFDNYQTTYDSKTKIVVFYFLSIVVYVVCNSDIYIYFFLLVYGVTQWQTNGAISTTDTSIGCGKI